MRKLTDSDKQNILKLYRETSETTSTLADRYDVSNSTISRLLKSTLPEDEYEHLVSLKRAARTSDYKGTTPIIYAEQRQSETIVAQAVARQSEVREDEEDEEETDSISASRRVRRRTSAVEKPTVVGKPTAAEPPIFVAKQLEIPATPSPVEFTPPVPKETVIHKVIPATRLEFQPLSHDEDMQAEANANVMAAQMLGEDLLDEDEDQDEEDYDDDDDDDVEETPILRRRTSSQSLVQVLPLSEASLPRTCYLVIDRSSELITRPLKDFGDLGQIPTIETQQKTLPIFDNHRVAKRFSTKRDRVIKVPDSKMLQKARYHLQAKGITRLLIDGQVYSLSIG